MEEYVKAWLTKGNHHLIAAETLFEYKPMVLDTVGFHCQQAIEKYLKAFLVFSGVQFGRTHSLDYLLLECSKLDSQFELFVTGNLDDYAVNARYPDSSIMPEENEIIEYLILAKEIKILVKEKIGVKPEE